MAKSTRPPAEAAGDLFDIIEPDVSQPIAVPVPPGTMYVKVRINAAGAAEGVDGFQARIYLIGAMAPINNVVLSRIGLTSDYEGSPDPDAGTLPSGPPTGSPPANRTLEIEAFSGVVSKQTIPNNVYAYTTGSSVIVVASAKASAKDEFFQKGQPAPSQVSLSVKGAAKGGKSSQVLLANPRTPGYERAWLSSAVDVAGAAGFWMLTKTDPSTWMLSLSAGAASIVVYRATTCQPRDCSFPIVLDRVDGSDAASWPRSVTVNLAS